jgi:hypothetical protein
MKTTSSPSGSVASNLQWVAASAILSIAFFKLGVLPSTRNNDIEKNEILGTEEEIHNLINRGKRYTSNWSTCLFRTNNIQKWGKIGCCFYPGPNIVSLYFPSITIPLKFSLPRIHACRTCFNCLKPLRRGLSKPCGIDY